MGGRNSLDSLSPVCCFTPATVVGDEERTRCLAREPKDASYDLRNRTDYRAPMVGWLGYRFCTTISFAGDGPRLPCGGQQPFPPYADLRSTPNIRVWRRWQLGSDWAPPSCTGWLPKNGIVVALAGQFSFSGSASDLLGRFGAISTLTGLRYWSVSENGWRVIISHATALEGPDLDRPRPVFSPAEMRSGTNLYFAHDDNRGSGEVVYRMKFERSLQTG